MERRMELPLASDADPTETVAPPSLTVVLPHDLEACPMARTWAREQLAGRSLPPAVIDDLVLCLDELVSNVILHTLSKPRVGIHLADGVRVEVSDNSNEPAAIRIRPGEPGLWGLRIVDNIAERWGSTAHDAGGKTVWFTIAL